MKLKEAVSIGRFCGLLTVEECIGNIIRHYNIFPHSSVDTELEELYKEYDLYVEGKLEIDFDSIDKKNKIHLKKYWKEQEEKNKS